MAARTGEAVLLPNASEAAARFPAMAEVTEILGIQALASLPLLVEGRLLGSFVVYWTTDAQRAGEVEELKPVSDETKGLIALQKAFLRVTSTEVLSRPSS